MAPIHVAAVGAVLAVHGHLVPLLGRRRRQTQGCQAGQRRPRRQGAHPAHAQRVDRLLLQYLVQSGILVV